MNSTIKVAGKVVEVLNQSNESSDSTKQGIQHIKVKTGKSSKEKWESKVMHGWYIRSMDRQLISEKDTFLWLSRGDLKGEPEREIIAAQDQTLKTKYHATKILRTETDSQCRCSKQFAEAVEHIISACPVLAKEQYIKRYDRVCAHLHFNIFKETEKKLNNKHWYDHVPKSVKMSHECKFTVLWNQ